MTQAENYLKELIDRLCDRSDYVFEPGFDSTKTNSFKAKREAEKLNDPGLIPALKKIIASESEARRRAMAYFILGEIAINTSDPSVSAFFIERIPLEKDKDALAGMLLNIKPLFKPKNVNIQPLLDLLGSQNEEVRQAAIQALNHCEDKAAEDALIRIASSSQDKYDILYAIEALGNSGSPSAIASLQKHANHKDKDVRTAAVAAVAAIKGRKK